MKTGLGFLSKFIWLVIEQGLWWNQDGLVTPAENEKVPIEEKVHICSLRVYFCRRGSIKSFRSESTGNLRVTGDFSQRGRQAVILNRDFLGKQ